MRNSALLPLTLLAGFGAAVLFGQQEVQFKNNIPVAPTGLASRPLPKLPMEFDTAEGQHIRVAAVTTGLEYPFGMTFLPDGAILVTERAGRLRIIRNGTLDPKPVAGTPKSYFTGESGLPGAVHGFMDVVLHPRFATNHYIYLSYTKPLDATRNVAAVARAVWDGTAFTQTKDIFVTDGTGPTRIAFGRDETLFLTVSGNDPQDVNTQGGKVLRIKDDGSIPSDNPFVGRAGARPEVFTFGHRNALGLALHPSGEMWQNENGPNGGDEINILRSGKNYGWPLVSLGRTYQGPWQAGQGPTHTGFEPPIIYWMPAIAVSGMTFYTGDKLPKWKGDVFVGSMRTGEIPGTGHLERILFNDKLEELRRETLLTELRQRIRDVRQGPDGFLYLLTDEKPGAMLRIEPGRVRGPR